MPAFRASLERGGRFLSPSHGHDSWAWVDDAFPSAVAALASAADDVSRRADALETFLVTGARDATVANETKTGTGILARRGTSRGGAARRLRRRARRAVAAVAATRGPPSLVSVAEAYFARRLAEFAERAEALEPEEEEEEEEEEEGANDDETEPETKGGVLGDDDGGASMDVDASSSSFGSGLDRQQSLMLSTGASGLARTHSLMPASAVARATASVAEVMGARWAAALASAGASLRESGLFGETCAAAAAAAVARATRRRVAERASGSFERRAAPPLLRWVDAVPIAFLKHIGLVTSIETDDASADTEPQTDAAPESPAKDAISSVATLAERAAAVAAAVAETADEASEKEQVAKIAPWKGDEPRVLLRYKDSDNSGEDARTRQSDLVREVEEQSGTLRIARKAYRRDNTHTHTHKHTPTHTHLARAVPRANDGQEAQRTWSDRRVRVRSGRQAVDGHRVRPSVHSTAAYRAQGGENTSNNEQKCERPPKIACWKRWYWAQGGGCRGGRRGFGGRG